MPLCGPRKCELADCKTLASLPGHCSRLQRQNSDYRSRAHSQYSLLKCTQPRDEFRDLGAVLSIVALHTISNSPWGGALVQRRNTSMRTLLLYAVFATRAAALEVHVVSLTPPTASEHYGAAGRAWRWKVAVMGEDMALPRPKTALALAESIVERSGGAVQEAATLSTCARLLLIVAGNEDAVAATREACAAQIASFQTRPFDDWRRALDAAGDDIVRTCVEIKFTARSS